MNPRSALVTQGRDRSPNRGMLRALGMTDADFTKAQIGIASSWNQITPCNMSLRDVATGVAQGITAGGGFPMEFGTITVSDVISMGHEGMHFSLVSREVIADSVETVMQAERLDGMVTLAGCDKSIPAMLMAAARIDVASVLLYAGSLLPGHVRLTDGSEHTVNIVTSFEAVGANARGLMSDEDLDIIERAVCPTAGTCGGMYTANTMASASEAMGMSLPGSSSPPAVDARRDALARQSGEAVLDLIRHVLRDFFGNPVAVHALRCNDQGEVNLALEVQVRDGIDQDLRLSCSHLHEEAIGFSVHGPLKRGHLVGVWRRLKI